MTRATFLPIAELLGRPVDEKLSRSTCMGTMSGQDFHFLQPERNVVTIETLAGVLSRKCRFGGHVKVPHYSVAQHLCEGIEIVSDRAKPYYFAHDWKEALGGDWVSPLLHALAALGAGPAVDTLFNGIDYSIYPLFNLQFPVPVDVMAEVDHADRVMLSTEERDIAASPVRWSSPRPDPLTRRLVPLPAHRAERMFLDTFAGLQTIWPGRMQPMSAVSAA